MTTQTSLRAVDAPPVTITMDDFAEMEESMTGLCLDCGEVRDCCEPDAENYTCEECGAPRVMGPLFFLMSGRVA